MIAPRHCSLRVAVAALLPCLALTACTVGPNYTRPAIETPEAIRGAATAVVADAAPSASLGDVAWAEVFQDQSLVALVQRALDRNIDLRLAATRVLQAESQLGITRADQFPTVTGEPGIVGQRNPQFGFTGVQARATAAWQLDFWGRFRRATEAARAQLLASEWGARAVRATLVSNVASAYLTLRALDGQLDVSRRTLTSREESLRLTRIREQGGATSLLDVRQAEQLVATAASQIATLERQIEQQENFIRRLMGDLPGPIERSAAVVPERRPAEVPAELPSTLLERRPDIQQAEQTLIAANAQIGVARAAYFPNISLTGSGGTQSLSLTSVLATSISVYNVAAVAAQPIFTAGRLRSQVRLTEAQRDEAVLNYQDAIQQAFQEISNALVGYRKLREFRDHQAELLDAARDARRLAGIRYDGGATSYLEVLDADTRLFSAELALTEADRAESDAYIEIYRALGGGWQ